MIASVTVFVGEFLRHFLQVLQKHGGDLWRAVILALDRDANVSLIGSGKLVGEIRFKPLNFRGVKSASHQTLDGIDGIPGIRHHLALGDLAEQPIAFSANATIEGVVLPPRLLGTI